MSTMSTGIEAVPGDAEIAEIGTLVADRTRCRVLMALNDGRASAAGMLADEAGVAGSTASSHLAKLTGAGFLRVETHGRHRYYRLAGPHIGELLGVAERCRRHDPGR
jgi:DNA-binding transcriptional ArsR family regulator